MEKAADLVDMARDQLTASLGAKDGTDFLEKIHTVVASYNELAETCKKTLQQNPTASHRFRSSWIRKLREAEKGQAVWKFKAKTCEDHNKAAIAARAKAAKVKK